MPTSTRLKELLITLIFMSFFVNEIYLKSIEKKYNLVYINFMQNILKEEKNKNVRK